MSEPAAEQRINEPVEYVETLYTSCGDVVKTPARAPDEDRTVVAAGYCIICTMQD